MENQTPTNSIRKDVKKGNVTIDKIYASNYQKAGTLSVQLRQEIETTAYYPALQPNTGGLFSKEEFGIEEKPFTSNETRVAWLDVPENVTMEQVQAKLDALPNKGLVKVLSNKPIITPNQQSAIDREITTLDVFANAQIVRYPEGHENAGAIILDKSGKVQYRVSRFEGNMKEDTIDLRNDNATDYYQSPEIEAELVSGVGAMSEQRIGG
jgi:hypothetical protein